MTLHLFVFQTHDDENTPGIVVVVATVHAEAIRAIGPKYRDHALIKIIEIQPGIVIETYGDSIASEFRTINI